MGFHQGQWPKFFIFLGLLVLILAKNDDYSNDERYAEFSAGKGERGLFPNIFNLATHADIRATATCGHHGPEYYCKLVEHVFARVPQCDVCDANNHYKNHPIDYAIDGTPRHWQSPSLANGLAYEKVNITLDLRQEYQVAYVIVKAGNAPRPGTWVLEKSMDGVTYTPWQYFAINDAECMRAFGVPATTGVPMFKTDDEVICTSFYSKLEPLENGEIHISLVNQRPSAEHPSQILQNYTRTRFVRLRLLSLRTLNADLMIINRRDGKLDQSVTRRYFYSIKDISIGGQCICYGHAESCPPEEIHGQFRCECRHNTCGESCETCCPLFNQLPWQPGTHAHPNVCQPCQCFNHADRCEYDESIAEQGLSLTPDGVYEGGGKCIDCQHNTEGINCEKCKVNYYRPSNISHYQHNACVPCDCDMEGSEHNECIRDETAAFNGYKPGDCICKPGFGGRRCEKCAPGYRNYPTCERCPCHQAGSLNFETCEEKNCICKTNVEGQFCDRCKAGTIFLNPNNPQGCQPCFCFGKSTICREGFWEVGHISSSNNWTLTELHNFNAVIKPKSNSSELLIFNSNDYSNEGQLFYWKAPQTFSGDLLNSYGGDLRYYAYFVPQRDGAHPTPVADVIIEGNGIRIEHYSRLNFFPRENISVTIPLLEKDGWYNSQTRQPIDKSDLMRVLSDVKIFLIRARYTQEQLQSSIYGLTLETAIPSKTSNNNETSNSVANIFNFSSKKMNGVEVCDCPENFAGNSCEKCIPGYRRVNNQLYGGRCEKCNCEGHSDTCDPFTGNCIDCKHNTTGPRCEHCLLGHYGNPLLGGELGSCKSCACPNIENNHSPQCTLSQLVLEGAARANQDEYVCTACEQGYDGNKCEICADGYFGDPTTGTCQQCSCNGNIDLAAIGNCDRVSGECLRCIGHTTGESCERCEDNHWGSALDKTCKPCGCHRVGATSLQCSNSTGLCECNENYIGDRCDSCKPGHGDIEANCPECDCDKTGSTGSSCNQISGQCNCKAGIYGKLCDMCFPGYFNFTDQGCSFCHCDEYGSVDQKCSNTTGECECRENVEGTRCDHCVPGFFNITSKLGCQECSCNQLGSTSKECNAISGKCVCKDGVTGLKCDKCEPNHWGLDETGCKQCQVCPAPGQVCDPENGECVCPPNTIGEKCENCAKNSWNYDAYRGCILCDCDGVGADSSECDSFTGQCKCKSGFVGHKCDHCQAGYFNFPDCKPCNCDVNGTDPLECRDDLCLCTNDGQCKCKEHVTGLKCDSCNANSFSLDKYNPKGCTECFCFNRTNFCMQNSLVWQQLYTSDRRVFFEDPFVEFDRKNNLQVLKEYPNNYNSYLSNHAPLYWPLPKTFLGDRINSYNGYLRFKIWNEDNYRKQHGVRPTSNTFKLFPQVVLIGNDRIILENVADEISEDNKYKIKIHETKWKNKMSPQIPVTRQQLMVVLQNLQAVYIRGTYNHMYRGDAISLRDVSLDIAVENVTDSESSVAVGVELCADCPEGYSGASCQNPASGYCRKKIPGYLNSPDDLALIGYSTPCACNGHSTTCDPETCQCTECQHNTIGDFCEVCKPGYHGDAKEGLIDSCIKCACPLATNSFSDTCVEAETGRGYACDACKPGYSGLYCETCIPGYFGDPNTEGGYCQQCNCHPHGSLSPYCHNVTGQCECREGVDKRDCSGCRPRHAFIDRVCTSCDQGCYKDLMIMEDDMETQLITVKNLSDSKPIPKKRLRKINEAIGSYDEILKNIKINENSATYLPNIDEDNKQIKEALFVIEEASVLEEKTNETLNKLNKLQNDIQKIRKIGHDQNQRVIEISTTLNKFSTEVSQQIPSNVESRVEQAERILENLREKEKQIEKQLNYVTKNSEDAAMLLKEVLSKKLNDTSYDILFEQHEDRRKLIKDFRDTIWDDGKTNSTLAKKLTKAVNERLDYLKNTVDEIEKVAAEQQNDLAKTDELVETIKQTMLDTHDHYQIITDDLTNDLKEQTENLKQKTEKNVQEMRKDKSELHKAEQHAKEMEHKARRLKNQIADTNAYSNKALEATNSYKDIVEALVNASTAANEAKKSSEDAFNEIGAEENENSLVNQAKRFLEDSERIKKEFNELDGEDVDDGTKQLKSILEKIKKITEQIEKEIKDVKEAQNDLDDHEERIDRIKDDVEQIRSVVNNVIEPVGKISKDVDELQNRVDAVDNFNLQAINEDIANVTNSNSAILESVKKLDVVKERTNKQTEDLKNVKQRLAILKEKMNEAKEKASKVKISVKSEPKDICFRQYISPAHPSPTTTINIKFRPAMDVPDSLIFLTLTKSRRTQAREFLAIELKDRRIIVHWNIGHNSRRATNPHNIFYIASSNRYTWYHIDVTRIGNAIKFSVGQKQSLTGEESKNIDEPTIVTLGEPDVTSDVILNTVPGETRIHLGYEDPDLTNELGLGTNKFTGILGEMKVDGQDMPLWVFTKQIGNCDGAAGTPDNPVQGHFFRNGFAQIRMPMTERTNTLIRIVYAAYSADGLLYFRGNVHNKNFIAVEIRNGAVNVKANYGNKSYVQIKSSSNHYADGKVHTIRITRNNTELELQVDGDDDRGSITIPGNNNGMNLHDEDPHFVGGVPSDFDKGPFVDKEINWNGFVGCIKVVKPNQLSELDLDHPVRSQRKESGCTFKEEKLIPADRVIGFPKPGYLIAESIQLGTNSSLAFNLRTKNGNAILLYQKALKRTSKRATDDNDTFFAFYLYNGRLIVHLGTDTVDRLKRPSLSSNQSYNDGRLHSVFFARQGSSIEVRIDDREVLRGQLSDDKIIGSSTSKLYFGGLPDKLRIKNENIDIGTTEPLIGCLSDFYYNFEKWSIIPEKHEAQLGTCVFNEEITHETDDIVEQKSFERKSSKLSLQLAAPTYISSNDGYVINDQLLVNTLSDTCSAPNNKVWEQAKKEGARYGASETSHSRLTFERPYPDPKNFAISFDFRTETSDGVLWIWANYKNYTRYFLMYIEDGFLIIDIQGSQSKKQLQYKEKKLDDGEWHELKLTKENRELTVQVDDLLSEKITDAASPSVMRRRMYVGGVISKHKKIFKFPHDNFVGCMKNFIVDGTEKDLHAQTRDVIICKNTKDIVYLHRGGFMTFASLKSFSGPATDNQNIDVSIKFRTTNATGILLALLSSSGLDTKTAVIVELKNNYLVFKADHAVNGVQIEHKLHLPELCQSEWHRFHLTLTRSNIIMSIGEAHASFPITKLKKSTMDIFKSLPVYVGGLSANLADKQNSESLNGCYHEIHFAGTTTQISAAKRLHKVVADGCPLV